MTAADFQVFMCVCVSVGATVQVGEFSCQALCSMSLTHVRNGRVE